MNRALYLSRPDPDQNDLKVTALSIYHQLCPGKDNMRIRMIENLAASYFELKQYFTKEKPEYADFYGLRDFYHLIKHVARDIKKDGVGDRKELCAIAKLAIDRNFGGILHANEKMGEIFAKHQEVEEIYPEIPHCDVRELIEMNMADKDSRYLMLIGRSDVLTYILEKQFRKRYKQRRIMVGSHLENDVNKEEYAFKSLSDIILLMEKGIPIILNGMDHIESSLYDLFN
jgi:E3 ubiquitin-protein ligase RNF213